jgi:CHAT domain-containing protein
MISDINAIDFSLQELHEFETLSFGLYKLLLQPFEALIEGKQLLIVPDDLLSLIPFEILLSENTVSKGLNYSSLPYLVKAHDISYAYSLTLSHKQREIKIQAKNDQLLAMAPGYEKLAGNEGPQYVALRSAFRDARDQLGLLEGAQAEVKRISRNLKGKLIVEDKASEEQFKLTAPYYKVLHLAMHTLINNDDPLYSKLVFTPDIDELEDGLLNTYELSNMELNAELVVLSACNTGFGKLNKGEGIIGLSRGFLQAGCKI